MPAVSAAGAAKFLIFLLTGVLVSVAVGGCVKGQAAPDSGDPGFPFGPSSVSTGQLAYIPDIKPLLDRDCLSCHRTGGGERGGGYSVGTYADVLAGQRPGDAKSSLVRTCAPGGSMYRYFSGDAQTSATVLFRWLVYYYGAQTR
jgi:hypothetical protein